MNMTVGIFQDRISLNLNFNFVGYVARLLKLLLEILVLSLIVPRIGNSLPGNLRVGYPGVLPLRDSCVVVDKENPAVRVNSLLPSLGQRPQIILMPPVWHVGLTREGRGSRGA